MINKFVITSVTVCSAAASEWRQYDTDQYGVQQLGYSGTYGRNSPYDYQQLGLGSMNNAAWQAEQQLAVQASYPDEGHPYGSYLSYGGVFSKSPQYGYAGYGTYDGIEPGSSFVTNDDNESAQQDDKASSKAVQEKVTAAKY